MKTFRDPRSIVLNVGDEFCLVLPSSAGSGYVWEVESLPSRIESLGSEFALTGLGIGATGEQHLRFHAKGDGDLKVRIVLKRPWETGILDMREVAIRVME